jgi:hypothetical protein
MKGTHGESEDLGRSGIRGCARLESGAPQISDPSRDNEHSLLIGMAQSDIQTLWGPV